MNLLIFDVIGKMAHFRKYYTNSSSLSYYFPPRTALTGLIAGIIGMKRDTYYEIFSSNKTKIAISIKTPLRKIIQTVNYVWADEPNKLNLSKGQHTQIPLEVVVPDSFEENIRYRIFFSHTNEEIIDKVLLAVKDQKFVYPPYLGISEFIAKIEFVDYVDSIYEEHGKTVLDSILNIKYLENGVLDPSYDSLYIREMTPFEFDNERNLVNSPAYFIVEVRTGKIAVQLEKPYYKVIHRKGEENIVFMEWSNNGVLLSH